MGGFPRYVGECKVHRGSEQPELACWDVRQSDAEIFRGSRTLDPLRMRRCLEPSLHPRFMSPLTNWRTRTHWRASHIFHGNYASSCTLYFIGTI